MLCGCVVSWEFEDILYLEGKKKDLNDLFVCFPILISIIFINLLSKFKFIYFYFYLALYCVLDLMLGDDVQAKYLCKKSKSQIAGKGTKGLF